MASIIWRPREDKAPSREFNNPEGRAKMYSTGVAYLLWLGGIVGFCGLHRFYAGKVLTGLLWFFTLGLLGFGQLLDLLLIPHMINQANYRIGWRPRE
jgi:TM2 domain-containing membrane protein YozV